MKNDITIEGWALVLLVAGWSSTGCGYIENPVGDDVGTASTESTSGADSTSDADSTSSGSLVPDAPALNLTFSQIKQFEFNWENVAGASHYRLFESVGAGAEFLQLGGDIMGQSTSLTMPLHFRVSASYKLHACNVVDECSESGAVDVVGTLAEAAGYFKAPNPEMGDEFGVVALSDDGNTMAIGAEWEDSSATDIGGNPADESAPDAGAVYIFVRNGLQWSQQAYVKASNTDSNDRFGHTVTLSGDGNTMAVGAVWESSSATGVGGDQSDDSAPNAGAVYVFVRNAGVWSQQAYIKPSSVSAYDVFGNSVALSNDGSTMAVGALEEDSNAMGIDGDSTDESMPSSGAVYVFVRNAAAVWSQQAYVKASNTDSGDYFGTSVSLSGNGDTMAVGAMQEDSVATGVSSNQLDNSSADAGAVYLFVRDATVWTQQAYAKAASTSSGDNFGYSVTLSGDGETLAVGVPGEDSSGIGGNTGDDSTTDAGAAYVFVRTAGTWSQNAYIKASNTSASDWFGGGVVISDDGTTLAVRANGEDGNAIGVNGNPDGNSAPQAGAVYVFVRDGGWSQQAYVKASNTSAGDRFGDHIALSGDGTTLAVGAGSEDSNDPSIGGDQASDLAPDAGAVYLY